MSEKYQIVRKCKDCPTWTQTVCRYAFGVFWCVKSGDGEGCGNPLDDVAEAWRKAGWTPGEKPSIRLKLPMDEQKPKTARRKAEACRQTSIFQPSGPPAEPPPLSDDDY